MEEIISPTALSLAEVLKAVHEFNTRDPFCHLILAQLIFHSQS